MNEIVLNRISKFTLRAVLVLIFLYLCYLLSDILIIFVISVLLSLIFDPFVSMIEKKGLSRLLSSLIIFAVFFFIFYLIFSFLVPSFIQQMKQLIEKVKVYLTFTQLRKIGTEVQRTIPLIKSGDLQDRITNYISVQVENSFNYFSTLFSSLVSTIAILVIVPFITFFLTYGLRESAKASRPLYPSRAHTAVRRTR